MNDTTDVVLTLDHSDHSLEDFIRLLRLHAVTEVADVRSVPYRRFNPQFRRESLAPAFYRLQVRVAQPYHPATDIRAAGKTTCQQAELRPPYWPLQREFWARLRAVPPTRAAASA